MAELLICRLDKENTLQVTWEEWRDYFRLHPTTDLMGMVHNWRHGTVSSVHHPRSLLQGHTLFLMCAKLRRISQQVTQGFSWGWCCVCLVLGGCGGHSFVNCFFALRRSKVKMCERCSHGWITDNKIRCH